MKTFFEIIDQSGRGYLTPEDLQIAIYAMGFGPEIEETLTLQHSIKNDTCTPLDLKSYFSKYCVAAESLSKRRDH